jgi:hypothetical protein
MSSTITTAVMTVSVSGAFAAIGVLLLLALLFQKELASAAGGRYKKMSRLLNTSTVPFLIAFVLIVLTKVLDVIR